MYSASFFGGFFGGMWAIGIIGIVGPIGTLCMVGRIGSLGIVGLFFGGPLPCGCKYSKKKEEHRFFRFLYRAAGGCPSSN